MDIAFYNVDLDYIEFLKKYENSKRGFTRVPNVQYHSGNNKFFYGAVLNINGIDYFVPISSKQHNRQDDIPIKTKDKFKTELSTLRFAYMLPIPKSCLFFLDIKKEQNNTRKETLLKELAFCRRNKDKIAKQAQITYDRIVGKINPNLIHNSCDFKLLEEAYIVYCHDNGLTISEELKKLHFEITNRSNFEQPEQASADIPYKKEFTFSRKQMNDNAKKVADNRSSKQPGKNKIISNDFSDKNKGSEPR